MGIRLVSGTRSAMTAYIRADNCKPIEPDWAIIDNLRNNDKSPESLVKRVMSMSSQDRKKVGSQI